ncbi:hypothetical protein D3C73_1413600 [compost metagenome]
MLPFFEVLVSFTVLPFLSNLALETVFSLTSKLSFSVIAKLIKLSVSGFTSFAFAKVVSILPLSNNDVTKLLSKDFL